METKSSPTCPYTVTVRRNPHRKARPTPLTNPPSLPSHSTAYPKISSFPIQDILSEEIPSRPPSTVTVAAASLPPSQDSAAEYLKVFLRIRPHLVHSTKKAGDQNPKSRPKNVWPKNPKTPKNSKNKGTESCITVSEDSQSITLAPPLALQEAKRMKSEIYGGFSYVFSSDSTQNEVYQKMVNPLVEDFLRGKSGMLAALGPTGSGKTHTVFGSPREPGMVPRALQRIFEPAQGCSSQSSCQFYLSIFEICAERGKAERMCDLISDGPDLSMQQSGIKGLQEVVVHDTVEAEQLIARALLKRSTAATNANSQSSRSQCIINIRRGADSSDAETDAVLSIVDLAGAEREKRTGNQGARLAESNFINNTSMVFGLCLRSLLEHQKNPKKTMQKHFQNSLLTRYLRDYLEGKKRMALILTVKSGEEDYLDTSYLLRQSSPYMNIKFTNIETQSNVLCNKRQFQTTSRAEQRKRMKLGNPDASVIEGKIVGDENQLADEEDLRSRTADLKNGTHVNLNSDDVMKRERTHQIMQNFAKALWSVLKQHNEKLKVAETEIQILKENLRDEKKRSIEMEKELNDLRSCCTCSKEKSAASLVNVGESFDSIVQLEGHTSVCGVDETKLDLSSSNPLKSECTSSHRPCDSDPGDEQVLSQDEHVRSAEADVSSAGICISNDDCQSCQPPISEVHESLSESGHTQEVDHTQLQDHVDVPETEITLKEVEHTQLQDHVDVLETERTLKEVEHTRPQDHVDVPETERTLEEVEHTQPQDHADVPKTEIKAEACNNSLKKGKPKRNRRLLPASSVLVREISTLDADEFDKPRGNGGGKTLATSEKPRTQGSISLLRLLNSNLHSLA